MLTRSLENLAKNCKFVFLDNCIMNLDHNVDMKENDDMHQGKTDPSLATRLGAASNFSEVKQSNLNRHAAHAQRIKEMVLKYKSIVSCPEIMKEYLDFFEHIDRTRIYFKERSNNKRPGKKETKLREIIDTHRNIYQCFKKRKKQLHPDYCSDILIRRHMHLSYDRLFTKVSSDVKKDVSLGDAKLVGSALTTAFEYPGEVAIVTRDLDVVNLLRNFAKFYSLGRLNSELRGRKLQGSATVYIPSKDNWIPKMGLQFVCDTKGHFVFFAKEGVRVLHYSELGKNKPSEQNHQQEKDQYQGNDNPDT